MLLFLCSVYQRIHTVRCQNDEMLFSGCPVNKHSFLCVAFKSVVNEGS